MPSPEPEKHNLKMKLILCICKLQFWVSSLISSFTRSLILFTSHWRFSKQFSPQEGEPSISAGTVLKHQVHLFLQQNTEDMLGGGRTK